MNSINLAAFIADTFSFVSSNASNMITQMIKAAEGKQGVEYKKAMKKMALDTPFESLVASGSLEGKVLIVDEAHNFFRAITNGSANAIALYDIIMRTKSLKIFFLSGTPISNDPFETVPMFNMLSGIQLFPTDYSEFRRIFISGGKIANKEKFQNRIHGLVSRATAYSRPIPTMNVPAELLTTASFPELLPRKIIAVPMSEDQYPVYFNAREKELEESSRAWRNPNGSRLQKPKNQASSSYRQQSRQLSNWCPPASHRGVKFSAIDPSEHSIISPKYDAALAIIESSPGCGYVYSQFTGAGGLGSFAKYLIDHGYALHKIQQGIKLPTGESEEPPVTGGHFPRKNRQVIVEQHMAKLKKALTNSNWWQQDSTDYQTTDFGSNHRSAAAAPVSTPDPTPTFSDIRWPLNSAEREELFRFNYSNNVNVSGSNESTYSIAGQTAILHIPPTPDILASIEQQYPSTTIYISSYPHETLPFKPYGPNKYILIKQHVTGGSSSTRSKTFCIISGQVDDLTRQSVLRMYSSDANKYGEECSLLLFSSTGAEGLDLKNQRYGIVLEPYWTSGRLDQVERRGARSGSHKALKPDEQTFQLYVLCAVKPTTILNTELAQIALDNPLIIPDETVLSTDIELYLDAYKQESLIKSFTNAIYETAFDCTVMQGETCVRCKPTDKPLFSDSIDKDLVMFNQCIPAVETTIEAIPIDLDGTTYYYKRQHDGAIDIYEFNKELNSYIHIEEYSPTYSKIIDLIE